MKMENEIVAPSDGVLVSINVDKGASVNAGDLLASLD
jgi:biotin carboxyl carrier protein